MEIFVTFFWGTLGIVAGLTAPSLIIVILAGICAAISSLVGKDD